MIVTAVTGIDHGDGRVHGCYLGSTFLGMTHCCDVSVGRDDADGVCDAFTLGCGRRIGRRKTKNTAPEIKHCSFKT